MRPHPRLTFATSTLALICWAQTVAAQQIETAFSPRGGCAAAIAKEIDAAKTSIDLAAYEFTSAQLTQKILEARARGVAIRVILDRVQEVEPCPEPKRVRAAGLPMKTDKTEKLFHNKYLVIDGTTVITGSYNWSENAEQNNAENVVIIHDIPSANAFTADFNKHWEHSTPFATRTPRRRVPGRPQSTSNPKPPPTTKGS